MQRIDSALAHALGGQSTSATFGDVVVAARGAAPDLVAERLTVRKRDDLLREPGTYANSHCGDDPELHPLHFEWYFTDDTVERLASTVRHRARFISLGVPTVAAHLAEAGREVTVVDANALIPIRFPNAAARWCFVEHDLRTEFVAYGRYDEIIFDAPWYLVDVLVWLTRAQSLARRGGRIVFSLFPELTRTRAEAERDAILDVADALGTVTVEKGELSYRTPGFESAALRAAGVPGPGDWRRGDLVTIDGVNPDAAVPAVVNQPSRERWRSFTIGCQVVALRESLAPCAGSAIAPVPGVEGWTLDSVKRSDRRRHKVDLWTSRNRVARVGQPNAVAGWLDRLGAASPLDRALTDLLAGTDSGDEIRALASVLSPS